MSSDAIEKRVVLKAPRARVWRAITDSKEFGEWFGVKFDAPFEVGGRIVGHITTKGYEGMPMAVVVERMQAPELFSYWWHPYDVDPKVEQGEEPLTLVEFRLAEAGGGTELVIRESGFDRLPPGRRAEAFPRNDEGWSMQTGNIQRHVEKQ